MKQAGREQHNFSIVQKNRIKVVITKQELSFLMATESMQQLMKLILQVHEVQGIQIHHAE
jgi:hypothetical protein